MSAFQNIGIEGYFNRYGIKNGLLRGAFLSIPFHMIKDYENKKILYYHYAKKYLQKNYIKYAKTTVEDIKYGICDEDNPVWIYWRQGIKNAPILVKKCIRSIEKYSQCPVIQLDEENINKYVNMPEEILKKYKKGKISEAALSDLIRFSLLNHFGGTWIDATVLLTGEIPQYIIKSDFFAYQDTFGLIENPALISNWLLHSKPNNPLINEALNMTYAYWKYENYVIDYLFTYMILQIAYERNKDNCGWFPYANSDYCHQYLNMLDENYSFRKLEHIKGLSNIHKLTYKLKDDLSSNHNNFYTKLMEKDME